MKIIYKKRYGKDWKKYFLNPFRAYSGYMPIQFDGDEVEKADQWEQTCESGPISDILEDR